MQETLVAVKKEEVKEVATLVRPRVAKGKGKDPVRQVAREEASDRPEDESMEDNEHLFGMIGPLPAARCLPYTDLLDS